MPTQILERLVKDKSYTPVQVATGISTQDDASNTSPLSFTGATATLDIPDRAVEIILRPTQQLRVSEDSTMTRYFLIDAGMDTPVPVANTAYLYITRHSNSGTLYFRFNQI